MVYHVTAEYDGVYVLDSWQGADLDSWAWRTTAPAEKLPDDAVVGDVLEVVEGRLLSHETPTFEDADEELAESIRTEFKRVQQRLREHADDLGIDLDASHQSIEDGDIVLLLTRPDAYDHRVSEIAYVYPEGIWSRGRERGRSFEYLVNCRQSALESGMAFDVEVLDYMVCALRFNREETELAQSEPCLVGILQSFEEIADRIDEIDTKDDLVEPLYAVLNGFDDGQYYSNLYDSASPPPDGKFDEYRMVADASAFPPYTVQMDWPYQDGTLRLVEVDEVIWGENEYSEHWSVALLDRDTDPIRP